MPDERLEPMGDFFSRRVAGYDEHMLRDIEGSKEFYPYTASLLPPGGSILDLGCGTGLELDHYFAAGGGAAITGIDLSEAMLAALRKKHPDREMTLIRGSYFDIDLGGGAFDAAVSVESLHHFTYDEKLPLYSRLRAALKRGGYFILTDYFCGTEELQAYFRSEYERLKRGQGLDENAFFHYDTPLTVENEIRCLTEAGFSSVCVLRAWENTKTIKATA
ncbi:MAG: class I SAM-dependent methyltransferase [Clostridiales bacterium]|nr:class I SAM-dependent methyltransferase [Clostridiales bacterium]